MTAMRGPSSFLPTIAAAAAFALASGVAVADREQLTEGWPAGNWLFSFYLPDSYLPNGFYYDPNGRHFIFQSVDPGCNEAHCRRYFIGPAAHCANYSLSDKPGESTSPAGYSAPFAPRDIGGVKGWWNQGFQSDSALQTTFVFKIGSCVIGLYVDAGQASPKRGPQRFARPSEEEVLQTYRQFHAAFGRYIADRGWMRLDGMRQKPDFSKKTPPATDGAPETPTGEPPEETPTPPVETPPPDETPATGEEPGSAPPTEDAGRTRGELSPAEVAAAGALAGGVALLGSLLTLGASGVRREEILQSIRDLLRGRPPEDPFEAWKRKYEALGWKYSKKDGVATFEPVEGARNEGGGLWSKERGGFAEPAPQAPPRAAAPPKDGDVNESGEVWSSFSGGYVGRETYDRDMASRAGLAEKDRRDLLDAASGQDEDVAKLRERWLDAKERIAVRKEQIAEAYRVRSRIEGVLDRLEADARRAGELDANRQALIWRMRDRAADLAFAPDPSNSVEALRRLGQTAVSQGRSGFDASYSYRDALVDTALQSGALAADLLVTRGAASAGLASYQGAQTALAGGASAPEAVVQGVQAGLKSYFTGKAIATGQQALGEIPAVSKLIEKARQTEIRLWPKPAAPAPPGAPVWGANMRAVQSEFEARAAAKLPAGHPARQIGELNEALSNAGPRFNARLVNPHARLDPTSPTYAKAVEALTKDPKYLTPQAKAAADAVRYDLKIRAAERALETVYAKHPELRGAVTGLQNTGSHALKGLNYRGLDSDIDFTPMHDGSANGVKAATLFKQEFDGALRQVSKELTEGSAGAGKGVEVGAQDLKINVYANNAGRGAFRSEGGLKVKDMLNQTSGSIEKIDGVRVTHRLNGSDPVEIGEGARWTTGAAREIATRDPSTLARIRAQDARQLADFRSDCLNKYAQELGEMPTPAERLHQAGKLYRLTRVMETKNVGGRSLGVDRELLNLAGAAKSAGLSPAQQDAAAQRLLEAIRSGK